MPPRSAPQRPDATPLYDFTGRRVRFVPPPPAKPENEPSPLLEAIRSFLERA